MINQNYLFHIFVTKNRSSNNKNIEFENWECFIYETSKKILMIKPKKYVGGSSAVPRVFFGILVHVPRLGFFTKVLESTPSDRQTEKSYGFI